MKLTPSKMTTHKSNPYDLSQVRVPAPKNPSPYDLSGVRRAAEAGKKGLRPNSCTIEARIGGAMTTHKDAEEWLKLVREYGRAVVELAIVRSELNTVDDDVDMGAVAEDAVNAAQGIATCDEGNVPELDAILAYASTRDAEIARLTKERDELESFKVNMLHAAKLDHELYVKLREIVEELSYKLNASNTALRHLAEGNYLKRYTAELTEIVAKNDATLRRAQELSKQDGNK